MTMLTKIRRVIVVATLLGVAASAAAAQAQTAGNGKGRVIDSQGWQLNNHNADHSCFATLAYLSSPDACGGSSGY
jgi:phosphate-selective porin